MNFFFGARVVRGSSRRIESETERRERMAFLAQISPRHAQEFARCNAVKSIVQQDRASLEWAAQISPAAAEKLQTLREEEAHCGETRSHSIHEADWDPDKHPRGGFPENRGWFSSNGGNASAKRETQPSWWDATDSSRANSYIRSRSGENWTGGGILDVVGVVAPKWLDFVKQHVTVSQASNGAHKPTTTVRAGEFGPIVTDLKQKDQWDTAHQTIHFEVPPSWNDAQVAQYILKQMADDPNAHYVARDWALARDSDLFFELRSERFRNGLETVAKLAKSYYSALAGLTPGGQLANVAWDIQEKEYLSAAIGVAFLLPVGEIAEKGLETAGNLTIQAGEKALASIPAELLAKVKQLLPEQRLLLTKRMLAANTPGEAAAIAGDFLKISFDRHHPIAKFLGGESKQLLDSIPRDVHVELHRILGQELKAAGFMLPMGGVGGATRDWVRIIGNDAIKQSKVMDAIFNTSRAIDKKYGTEVASAVWKNVMGKTMYVLPQ